MSEIRNGLKLKKWLIANKLTQIEFGRKIGLSESSISTLISEATTRKPHPLTRELIEHETDGNVKASDW